MDGLPESRYAVAYGTKWLKVYAIALDWSGVLEVYCVP